MTVSPVADYLEIGISFGRSVHIELNWLFFTFSVRWRYGWHLLCGAEQSYQSAVSQINDIRRKKALLHAHSQLAKETVLRVEEFTKQIRHKRQLMTELRKYDFISIRWRFDSVVVVMFCCCVLVPVQSDVVPQHSWGSALSNWANWVTDW